MMTLAQKLVARAAGRSSVTPGEIVTCKVDLAMMHDSGGPRRVKPMLERLGAKVWDPSKVVVITDHYVPTFDGSQTFAPRRSSIGFTRRGPLESWIIARSTLQVTISPGVTELRPAARAMSF